MSLTKIQIIDKALDEGNNFNLHAGIVEEALKYYRDSVAQGAAAGLKCEKCIEHNHSFKLRWDADMRGIKKWQADAPGRELTWPDQADLVTWLLNRIDKLENALQVVGLSYELLVQGGLVPDDDGSITECVNEALGGNHINTKQEN